MRKELIFAVFLLGILLLGVGGFVEAKKGENSGGSTSGSNAGSSSGSSTSTSTSTSTSSGSSSGSVDSSSKKAEVTTETQESSSKKTKQEETITLLDENNNEYKVTVRVETKNEGEESQVKIKVREVEINSETEFEQEGNSLKAKLSNGNKAEVKVMPDTASATAIEKLETKGINVQLKEVGEGNDLSVVYEAQGNKTVKFLGLFKVRTEVKAVISAENGELLRLERPWWYFMAFKEGVVDCDENNLDLCDDSFECAESGLIWFNDLCVTGCPEDAFVCDDNLTVLSRSEDLGCGFDYDLCPVPEITNETISNETI